MIKKYYMSWWFEFFNGCVHVFSHWYFLKKDEIVALTLMCKNIHMQKSDMNMSWDFAMNERLHHRLFAPKFSSTHAVHSVFCNLLTLTYFDLFHKITTKTCYKSRRAADLAKHHDDPSKCQFLFHNSMVHNSETGLISMLQCTSMISSETPHRRTHPHNGFKFFLYENF